MGFMRWLTVDVPGDRDRQILLEVPVRRRWTTRPPTQVRELVTKGATGGSVVFTTDDCRKTYDELVGQGRRVHPGADRAPYGIDCGLRDPFGNHLRITQPAAVEPTEAELRDAFAS